MSKVLFKKNLARSVTLGKTTEITYDFHKTRNGKNTDLEIADIKQIYASAEKELESQNVQTVVRVMGKDRIYTLKGYTDHDLTIDDYEDYLVNRVKDTDKFNKFFQLQLIFKIKK
jgi:hypothetical protein